MARRQVQPPPMEEPPAWGLPPSCGQVAEPAPWLRATTWLHGPARAAAGPPPTQSVGAAGQAAFTLSQGVRPSRHRARQGGPQLPRRRPLQAAPGRGGLLLLGPGGCRFSFPPAPIAVQPAAKEQPGAWSPGESGLTFPGQVEAAGFPVGLAGHRGAPCGETCKWGVAAAVRGRPLAGRCPSAQHLVPQWIFPALGRRGVGVGGQLEFPTSL